VRNMQFRSLFVGDKTNIRLPMDVTDKDSILEAKKNIEEKEGKLHILVNKYVGKSLSVIFRLTSGDQCRSSRSYITFHEQARCS
jgi:hypothetical protein